MQPLFSASSHALLRRLEHLQGFGFGSFPLDDFLLQLCNCGAELSGACSHLPFQIIVRYL